MQAMLKMVQKRIKESFYQGKDIPLTEQAALMNMIKLEDNCQEAYSKILESETILRLTKWVSKNMKSKFEKEIYPLYETHQKDTT